MKNLLKYSLPSLVLVLAASAVAHAGGFRDPDHRKPRPSDPPSAPEVDPAMAMSGIALIAGALTVMRMKRR